MSHKEKTLSSQASDWREGGRRLRAFALKHEGWKQQEIAYALGVSKGPSASGSSAHRSKAWRASGTSLLPARIASLERGAVGQATRTSGPRSPGPRTSGGGVDVREGSEGDPQRVQRDR